MVLGADSAVAQGRGINQQAEGTWWLITWRQHVPRNRQAHPDDQADIALGGKAER